MDIPDEQIKTLLLDAQMLSLEDFERALKEARETDTPILEYLPKSGLISDNHLGQLLADMYKANFIDLSGEKVTKSEMEILPEIIARSQRAVVFRNDTKIHLATTDPNNYEFFKLTERRFEKPVEVYYATPFSLNAVLRQYGQSFGDRIEKMLKRLRTGGEERDEDIVKFVSLVMSYAHTTRASDVHLEPLVDHVSMRFRIDGILHEFARYPLDLHEKVVFRIKIMSRLRTDEHAAPQDGRFSFVQEATDADSKPESFDVRVSILPVTSGENVVMRLLAEHSERFTLTDLGFSDIDLEKVERASRKPYGMILSVGPTGAGKTTSLYALLQTLNDMEVNIMTIEDPVEYAMEHVQQTQVNDKKHLTFATGLRSIVRQDPDIIMVGEIRDKETADIAVNAAMTGHLVLSTLHANDAATTFPRLAEMGVEPFLVASSVNVIIAQRLTRKICHKCKTNYFLDADELALLGTEPELTKIVKRLSGKKEIEKIRFYRGAGSACEVCGGTGYNGRVGIFEVMEVSERLRVLISGKASADVITKTACEEGMTTMLEDGVAKMLQGLTSLEEVIRTTKGG